jgi:hypothetical protein
MAKDDTDDSAIFREAEAVFASFVSNANALGHDPRTVRAALQNIAKATAADTLVLDRAQLAKSLAESTAAQASEAAPEYDVDDLPTDANRAAARVPRIAPAKRIPDPESFEETRVEQAVLLTRRRSVRPETMSPLGAPDLLDTDVRTPAPGEELFVPASPRGLTTQRREARALVPEVAAVAPAARPVQERGEDGEIPPRELARLLADMATLLRWGHGAQVRDELEKLRRRFPSDLLLMRRIAEFHLEVGQNEAAMDVLFALASRLFERRNVEGMRAALEQVLVLDPGNARARKLLALLVKRDSAPP